MRIGSQTWVAMDRNTSSLSDPASQREGAIAAYGDGEIDVVEHIHAVILVLFVAERFFSSQKEKSPLQLLPLGRRL